MANKDTPLELLKEFLRVNKQGIWFLTADDVYFTLLPKWYWARCKRICPNARVID